MKKISKIGILIASLSLILSSGSFGASLTTTPKATATLASSCAISTSPINFGDITPISTTQDVASATGNLAITCSNNLSYKIALNFGAYVNHTRNMNGGTKGARVPYIICSTPAGIDSTGTVCTIISSNWYSYGNAGDDYQVSKVGTGTLENIPMYGYLYKGFFTPDNYSDTVTATISY